MNLKYSFKKYPRCFVVYIRRWLLEEKMKVKLPLFEFRANRNTSASKSVWRHVFSDLVRELDGGVTASVLFKIYL